MQDSLEDYIKLANNVNGNAYKSDGVAFENENKLISDARALQIVEFAIDGQLRPEVFMRCLHYINPSFYQDIVEERQLAQYCGYPICGQRIVSKAKQQYLISTNVNKVYDITERKNFCSNFCYKASCHVKEQIESSPLWSRSESDIPKFQLLLATENGIPGEDVLSANKGDDESVFTSVSDFAEASLVEAEANEVTADVKRLVLDKCRKDKADPSALKKIKIAEKYADENKSKERNCKTRDTMTEKNRSVLLKEVKTEVVENCKSLDKSLKMALEKVKKMKHETNKKSLLIETTENPEFVLIEPMGSREKACSREELQQTNQEIKMKLPEQAGNDQPNMDNIFHMFTTWTTLDTFLFLHGEERIRAALTERKLTNLFDRLRVGELSITQQVRYRDICRRMHMQDVVEKRRDGDLMGSVDGKGVRFDRKPLPEYAELKKESKELTVKVKAFFGGMPYDANSATLKVDQSVATENLPDSDRNVSRDEEVPVVLPLVDSSSRSAIRRRIFLNSANPQVRKHLLALNLKEDLNQQIQHLIHTFQLSSKNIVFKPKEWKLIGIVLIEILSIRNEDLQIYVKSEFYNNYLQSEFSSILDLKDYIIGIKNYLQNVELFIELYISSDK